MDMASFSALNKIRCEHETGFNHKLESWSLSDWLTATCGELGEAANVIKKLNRIRDDVRGNKQSESVYKAFLAREIADTFIYLDLLAQRAGIDLEQTVIDVFNAKSMELGCSILIGDDV